MSPVSADTLVAPTEDVATPTISSTPVTRIEIADSLNSAFDLGAATRAELIDTARAAGSRSELIAVLEELPADTAFGHLRQLWTHLPNVPIEN